MIISIIFAFIFGLLALIFPSKAILCLACLLVLLAVNLIDFYLEIKE